MIEYLTDSVSRCQEPGMWAIITSADESDDDLDAYCKGRSILCYRGDLEDVASRFLEAAEHFSIENIVRVTGDSPLLDHRLVDKALRMKLREDVDLATNVYVRTFPSGQSVEVFSRTLLADNIHRFSAIEREHVTKYFYENAHQFSIRTFKLAPPAPGLSLAVDQPEDLRALSSLIESLSAPHWTYTVEELIEKSRGLPTELLFESKLGRHDEHPTSS